VWRTKKNLVQQPKVDGVEIDQILYEIVDIEGPIHIELAAHRLAKALGFQKVGSRVMEAVNSSIRVLVRESKIKRINKFLWPNRNDFIPAVRQPELNEKDSFRTIKFVPPEEIELGVRNLIQSGFSILEDEVVKQIARIFGFDRTGPHIYDRIKGILKQMISRGDLVLKGDRLTLP